MKEVRALIIEANEAHRTTLVSTLCQYGVDAVGTADASEALAFIDDGKPNLIISDAMDSELSWRLGFEISRKWPKYRPYMVALAQVKKPVTQRLCEENGFAVYTGKPIELSSLLEWTKKAQIQQEPSMSAAELEHLYNLESASEFPNAKKNKKTKKPKGKPS